MSKIEMKTTTKTDDEEIAFLNSNDMMIKLKDQRGAFLPDDDPKRLDGFRRPVCYWVFADQSIRRAFIRLPVGVTRHAEIHEHPLAFRDLQQDSDKRLRVLDEVIFISHDFSWIHEARVTHVSDRVTLKPYGTETKLDWSEPSKQPAAAEAA